MIVESFKYVLKTPWKQIIADIHEYDEVRMKCRVARFVCENAYRMLVKNAPNLKFAGKLNACIVRWIDLKIDAENGGLTHNFYSKICDDYDDKMTCKNVNCVCYMNNQEYFDLVKERDRLEKVKKNFWKNKTMRVK